MRTRKQLAMLLALAWQNGRGIARDAMIDLLWSVDPEKKARHSLSQSVSLINKSLGAEIVTTTGRDRLVVPPQVLWLDAEEFERCASDGNVAEARSLWRGTLLEGMWINRAPNFERWLADERGRLERTRRRIAHAFIADRRAEGDHAAMYVEAEALLQLDPLDEKAMLAFLEALQLRGDRTHALRKYADFERRLKDELDAEPSAALRGWARRNRKGDSEAEPRFAPTPRVSEVTVLPMPQPIFGRKEEFGQLWSAWEQAQTGKGSFVILEGEAGIGKTALATKLVNQVHVAGGSVCFVKCYRTEKSVPFAPITALIRQLSRLPGFVGLDPVWIGELTRLVPELRERYPNTPQPMAVDDAARHRLSDATVQAAVAVADEQPLLIGIDDLQDADEATLAALHYIARQTSGQPLIVIGVRRLVTNASEFEQAFFEAVGSLGSIKRIAPLDEHEIGRVVSQVFAARGREANPLSVSTIVLRAQGNPLHAIEATLAVCDGAHAAAEQPVPSHDAVFDKSAIERLNRTSPDARTVAMTLAAAGRPLSTFDVAIATGLGPAVLSCSLAALEESQFVRRSGANVAFVHEGYTKVAYESASSTERRDIHLRLAGILSKSAAKNPAARYEVARHYANAGKTRLARNQALAAAGFAKSLGAERERLEALELAMEMAPAFDEPIATEQGECLLELREYGRLRNLCKRVSLQMDLTPEAANNFGYFSTAVDFHTGHATLRTVRDSLLELTESMQSFKFRANAKTLLMRLAYKMGDHSTTKRVARELRRELRTSQSDRGHGLQAAAYVAAKYYKPQRALPLLKRALLSAQHDQDLELEHLIRTGLAAVHRQLADYSSSITESETAAALARRTLNPQVEACDLGDIAVAEMSRGNLVRSRQLFKAAESIFANHADGLGGIFVLTNWGELDLMEGRIEDAILHFQEGLNRSFTARELPMTLQALAGLALCAQRKQNTSELARWRKEISIVGEGMECSFHDRWMTESTIAWDLAINRNGVSEALLLLDAAIKDLDKRDIDHSLFVRLERLRIEKACVGTMSMTNARQLEAIALELGAGTVLAGLGRLRNQDCKSVSHI